MRYRWCEACAIPYLDGEVHECVQSNARPDWRDLAEYPHPTFPEPAQWAWEFLRRNPSYRADWARYSALPERIKGGPGSALAEKYGRSRMADPGDAKAWPSLTWNVDRMRFISQHTRKADYPASVAPGEIWLKFNLTLPIKANMKRTKRALERFQEMYPEIATANKRDRFDKHLTYLQLLDAEEAGASYDEMAAALFPDTPNDVYSGYAGREKVKKAIARARELRDGGYLDLLL